VSEATWKIGMGIFEGEETRTSHIPLNVDVSQYGADTLQLILNTTSIQGISSLEIHLYFKDSADNPYEATVSLTSTSDEVSVSNPPIKTLEAFDIIGTGDESAAVKGAILSAFLTIKLLEAGNPKLTINCDGKYWANVVTGELSWSSQLSATAGEEKTDVLNDVTIDFDSPMDFRLEWLIDSGSPADWDILEVIIEALEAGSVLSTWTVNLKTQSSPSSWMTIPETADELRTSLHYKASVSTSIVMSLYHKFRIPPP